MKKGLNANQLKLLALIAMTVDHIGLLFLPQCTILRIIGRLSLPIYAFLVAEGCRHTRSMMRYLTNVAVLAGVCQIIYLVASQSLYQCILVTLSLSIGLIWLIQNSIKRNTRGARVLICAGVALAYFITESLPQILTGTGFDVDYGFFGVLLPVAFYLGKKPWGSLAAGGLVLVGLGCVYGGIQWLALLTLPILLMYNGQRGKMNLKYIFYLYYPAHLGILQLIFWLFA